MLKRRVEEYKMQELKSPVNEEWPTGFYLPADL